MFSNSFKRTYRDFARGPVVNNLPANAVKMGSIPGPGTKIPHDAEQLSPCTTAEVLHSRAHAPQEATTLCN